VQALRPVASPNVGPGAAKGGRAEQSARVILSFDVEEHFRIEAAAGLQLDPALHAHYRDRLDLSTRWVVDQLGEANVRATFFIVGQTARDNPALVRAVAQAGHEVASHGWDHQRLNHLTPRAFRADLEQSKAVLEQITGLPVLGYRAPTFSIVRETSWALDELAEMGFAYDSSLYPVRHDRYGVPQAPRAPFLAQGQRHTMLELPPATLRLLGVNFPMGGGGYFRLFPLAVLRHAIRQMGRDTTPPVATLYLHPWDLDPEQARLPLGRVGRCRTYVGINRSRARLVTLLREYAFTRAIDVVKQLDCSRELLPCFKVST
jgi:polysaccharide deacetylase family protein (PEP-CTERM system associated)